MTRYNFYLNTEKKCLCKPGKNLPITSKSDFPELDFGDEPEFILDFSEGVLVSGSWIVLAVDNDYQFYSKNSNDDLTMCFAKVTVTDEDVENRSVSIKISTRTKKFLECVNGKSGSVKLFLGVYIKYTPELQSQGEYVTLARSNAYANGIVADYGATPFVVPSACYYSKKDINEIYRKMHQLLNSATEAAESARESVDAISNLKQDIDGQIESLEQFSRSVENSNRKAKIWAEGTDEEVQEIGGDHSAKEWCRILSESSQGSLSDEELAAIQWLVDNIDKIKPSPSAAKIRCDAIVLNENGIIEVQGEEQNVEDTEDADGDESTLCKITLSGYVLGMETYASDDSTIPDRYYTKVVYDSIEKESNIYMSKDEYNYFAAFSDGKNVIRVFYIDGNLLGISEIHEDSLEFTDEGIGFVVQDSFVEQIAHDETDTDGDPLTQYRIDVDGYVLGIETYENSNSKVMDRYYTKTVYDSKSKTSRIYMNQDEYEYFASLENDKNKMHINYVSNSGGNQSEIKTMRLRLLPEGRVVTIGIEKLLNDVGDIDGDEQTLRRVDVNGYVLNIEGYIEQSSLEKSVFYTKMSYDIDKNVTHIFFTEEEYEEISSLTNGKNVVSIFYLI